MVLVAGDPKSKAPALCGPHGGMGRGLGAGESSWTWLSFVTTPTRPTPPRASLSPPLAPGPSAEGHPWQHAPGQARPAAALTRSRSTCT